MITKYYYSKIVIGKFLILLRNFRKNDLLVSQNELFELFQVSNQGDQVGLTDHLN